MATTIEQSFGMPEMSRSLNDLERKWPSRAKMQTPSTTTNHINQLHLMPNSLTSTRRHHRPNQTNLHHKHPSKCIGSILLILATLITLSTLSSLTLAYSNQDHRFQSFATETEASDDPVSSKQSISSGSSGSKNRSRSSQQNSWLDRNGAEARQTSLFFPDQFVAGGASSMLPSSTGTHRTTSPTALDTPSNHQRGRLIDRIASPSNQVSQHQTTTNESSKQLNNQQQQQQQASEKLDYIIEFIRQQKLSKFCDLLTNHHHQHNSLTPVAVDDSNSNNNLQQQQNNPIQQVISQLNAMPRFTLFVPTNEAMLLQPGNFFEQLRSDPNEAARFLLSHSTSELVVPKYHLHHHNSNALQQNPSSSSTPANNKQQQSFQSSLVYSLAGGPLQISILTGTGSGQQSSASSPSNKLELIVNGANVIPGHSYALQEPNNPNATHAIVHLIDRSLYPAPSENLLQLMRQYTPTLANLIETLPKSSSSSLETRRFLDSLESPATLSTFFAPNDGAFKATPPKLLDQLYTNRTFLLQFLKSHQLDGLHFNGQLAHLNSGRGNQKQHPLASLASLVSMSGERLEFEAKNLQYRQLIVVNSVPIVASDLMATNGVLHIVNRPLFPEFLLDDCKCGLNWTTNSMKSGFQFGVVPESPIIMSGRGSPPINRNANDLLERESSSPQSSQLTRAQRSNGKLPIGPDKNREFYRPSLAPANLKLGQSLDNQEPERTFGNLGTSGKLKQEATVAAVAQIIQQPSPISLAETKSQQQQHQFQPTINPNYEVTLNATSRLRMRAEQLQQQNLTGNDHQQHHQFVYDQPMVIAVTNPTISLNNNGSVSKIQQHSTNAMIKSERLKRPYLAGVVELSPLNTNEGKANSNNNGDYLTRGESAKREQRLLKFQPEDGRDTIGKTLTSNSNNDNPRNFTSTKQSSSSSNLMQPAYDYVSSPQPETYLQSQNQNNNKQQVANHSSTTPCFFYDADCRRSALLGGRLVRLPARVGGLKVVPNVTAAYDTSFGETSFTPSRHHSNYSQDNLHHSKTSNNNLVQPNGQPQQQQQRQGVNQLSYSNIVASDSPRLSALNQPLPPLSMGEQFQLVSGHHWRSHLGEISRITTPASTSTTTTKRHPHQQPSSDIKFASGRLLDSSSTTPVTTNVPQVSSTGPTYGHGFTTGISRQQNNFNSPQLTPNITFQLPRESPNGPLRQAHIMFIPVKLTNSKDSQQQQQLTNFSSHTQTTNRLNVTTSGDTLAMNLPGNVLVITPNVDAPISKQNSITASGSSSSVIATTQQPPGGLMYDSRNQYLTPINNHLAPMTQLLGSSSSNRHNGFMSFPSSMRSNLTLADDLSEGFDHPMGADINHNHHHHNNTMSKMIGNHNISHHDNYDHHDTNTISGIDNLKQINNVNKQQQFGSLIHNDQIEKIPSSNRNQAVQAVPLTPALIHRKNLNNQRVYFGNSEQHPAAVNDPVHSPASSSSGSGTGSDGLKWPTRQQQQLIQPGGDFSVTSARLTDNNGIQLMLQHYNATSGSNNQLLATQASDLQNLHTSSPTTGATSATAAADYFQDRTIAEIMDDSGLRIDGQLVTFKRLKQCLADANLFNIFSQTGNSATIFMPTDQAFQRLVQMAFGQRQQATSGLASTSSSRLQASLIRTTTPEPLPLVVRAPPLDSMSMTNDLFASSSSTANPLMVASLGALDRLTLDCQAPIVRQMLLDHISATLITPKQLAHDTSIESLSGRRLILSSVPSKQIVVVDGQPVLAATRAKNGMVYVINKFLNLTAQMPDVLDLMQTQPELSTFMNYVKSSNQMAQRLKRHSGPITVLAPTNDAFDQLSPTARQLINTDPSVLMDILQGHVLEGAQFGKLISMRARLNTMNSDQKIEAKIIKPNVYMLDNQMTSMRLVGTAANGVVNAIDRLIVPVWLRNSMSRGVPIAGGNNGLDTSASVVDSGTLAGHLARVQSFPANRLTAKQPELFHGNADTIFRNNHRNHHNLLPTTTTNNDRLNGDNFFRFGNSSTKPASISSSLSSSSSSSNLAGSSDADRSSRNLFPTGSLTNELSSIASNNNNNLTNNLSLFRPSSLSSGSTSAGNKNLMLIEKLATLMNAKKFLKLLLNSKVQDALKPDMNYVILVPTDQAIERLPSQILALLERDPEPLSDLINYHIIDTTFEYINTIPDGQTLQTLNEKDILFNWHRNNSILTVSGAIVLGGIQEENIALLIVDRVLYPTPGDLLTIVNKSPILSNFTSMIRNSGLENQLSRAGPFTLFAPSDAAFQKLDKTDLNYLLSNQSMARRTLMRHLSSPMVFTSSIALSSNMTSRFSAMVPSINITNQIGEDLILRQRNDYFSINDINFSYADVAASNGVLHVIDGFL